MELTHDELHDYIKKNGITKARTTKKFKDIPINTLLFFGTFGSCLSTFSFVLKDNKNIYNFDTKWSCAWRYKYHGKFIIELKFKAGDKVKLLAKTFCGGFEGCLHNKNDIGTITKIYGDGSGKDTLNCIVVDGNYYKPEELELITTFPHFKEIPEETLEKTPLKIKTTDFDHMEYEVKYPTYLTAKYSTTKFNKLKNKTMNAVNYAKKLLLSKEEKLFRELGLKDECGNYTPEYNGLRVLKANEAFEGEAYEIAKNLKKEQDKK